MNIKSVLTAGLLTGVVACRQDDPTCTNVYISGIRPNDGDLVLQDRTLIERQDYPIIEVCKGTEERATLSLRGDREITLSVGYSDDIVSRLLVQEVHTSVNGQVNLGTISCITEPEEDRLTIPEGNIELSFQLTEYCPEGL
jgi:hypothetical protein